MYTGMTDRFSVYALRRHVMSISVSLTRSVYELDTPDRAKNAVKVYPKYSFVGEECLAEFIGVKQTQSPSELPLWIDGIRIWERYLRQFLVKCRFRAERGSTSPLASRTDRSGRRTSAIWRLSAIGRRWTLSLLRCS